MSKLQKKKLDFIFNKIFLKLYTNVRNTTDYPMALELLREEIRMSVCIIVSIEFKILLNKMLSLYSKDMDLNLLIKTMLRFLIGSSRQKINYKLNLGLATKTLKSSTNWLYQEFQLRDSYSFKIILKSLVMLEGSPPHNRSYRLCLSLIENSIIKLSNILIYELFLDMDQPRQVLLKFYAVDSFLFAYSLSNIKLYLYWKFYIENLYLQIRRLSEDTYSIFVCTKFGFSAKKILGKKIKGQGMSPKFYRFFVSFLNLTDYLVNVTKKNIQSAVIEKL